MSDDTGGLHAAADRIRDTAKWITLSLAGIGAVALAGSQFSSVGALDDDSDRFTLAVLGAAAAGLAAVVALAVTAYVAVAPAATLDRLAKSKPWGSGPARKDTSLLGGLGTVAQLKTDYLAALQDQQTALTNHYSSPADPNLRTSAEAASARANALNAVAAGLTAAASYSVVAFRYKVAVICLIILALVGGSGLGLFVWAANPPDDAVASNANANVLTTPKAAQLHLTQEGVTALAGNLGSGCATDHAIGVLELADTPAGPDVLVQQVSCASIRLVLTSNWGTIS